ncbi:two-CW domain-containing protein [Thermodesulfobacteriota bacterium]
MKRKNCWEVMKCGREPNGKNEKLGICPAAESGKLDGINNGEYGGRFCWNFAGTFCKGEVQGTVAQKMKNCLDCGFFMLVNKEEGLHFIFTNEEAMK